MAGIGGGRKGRAGKLGGDGGGREMTGKGGRSEYYGETVAGENCRDKNRRKKRGIACAMHLVGLLHTYRCTLHL